MWVNFMGVGLVLFVDDMCVFNFVSNEVFLMVVVEYLVEYEFDFKVLMCEIMWSEIY